MQLERTRGVEAFAVALGRLEPLQLGVGAGPSSTFFWSAFLLVLFACATDVSEHPRADDISLQGPVGADERHPRQLFRHGPAAGKGDDQLVI